MLKATDPSLRLGIVRSDDKRRARLNCISHILKRFRWAKCRAKIKLPQRSNKGRYDDQAGLKQMNFVGERY
jgi:hypothetical protein